MQIEAQLGQLGVVQALDAIKRGGAGEFFGVVTLTNPLATQGASPERMSILALGSVYGPEVSYTYTGGFF